MSVPYPEGVTDESVTARPRRFRPELQGLRALAVLLVVVYHVWLDRVSGGVDVFFVISGFLITGQLYRASMRGRIEFRRMWGRMLTRLLPAALTVLAVVMAVAVVVLPEHRWMQTAREVVASALFFENWQLVANSADYFAQHSSASVFQHFWSLAIQGQFYLVWPLLVALVVLVARRAGRTLRRSLVVALAVVFALSLAYSIWLTASNQPLAYFHSATRVWEFALGGLTALVIDEVRVPRAVRIVFGWVGVIALVSCGLVLQVGTEFPGYVALWPTVAAVLVLVAGATESRIGADRFLSARPLVKLGNISYALYLWHWPLLVLFLVARDQDTPSVVEGAGVIAVSLVLAALTHRFVEQPARSARMATATPWGAYRFAVVVLLPVLVASVSWQVVTAQRASFTVAVEEKATLGAQAIHTRAPLVDDTKPLVPPFAALPDQFDSFSEEECWYSPKNDQLRICTVDPEGEPVRRVVVVGDSHSQQYIAAMRPIVDRRGWQVISMGKGGCPFTTNWGDEDCRAWNEAVRDEIIEMRPDVVVTMATRDVRVGLQEWTPPGYIEQWQALDAAGIPVVAIRDSPRYDFEPSECVQKHSVTSPECAGVREELLSPRPPYLDAEGVPPSVSFLDFSDYFCDAKICPPVIGNVLVYMDDNHVTATYLETMSPIVEEGLVEVMNWENDPVGGANQ
ncbi:acyltransferase family protein [Saccharomonospora glauca]|uniref:Putative acyltransferase n=1 Tax=Saccharomonospora glauca K62 TaxID=928724 RepID=I1D2J7_9PSEU|nr:acyltransferase family protein [Saccharomonospora glauca]EIE99171.1 putative acyltransferase [Saccharomonospora glauca K62]